MREFTAAEESEIPPEGVLAPPALHYETQVHSRRHRQGRRMVALSPRGTRTLRVQYAHLHQ